jgi:hypothetical protein
MKKTIELMNSPEIKTQFDMTWYFVKLKSNGKFSEYDIKVTDLTPEVLHECGTSACLAGFTVAANIASTRLLGTVGSSYSSLAENILKLEWKLREALFLPNEFYCKIYPSLKGHSYDSTKSQGIKYLRRAVRIQERLDMKDFSLLPEAPLKAILNHEWCESYDGY